MAGNSLGVAHKLAVEQPLYLLQDAMASPPSTFQAKQLIDRYGRYSIQKALQIYFDSDVTVKRDEVLRIQANAPYHITIEGKGLPYYRKRLDEVITDSLKANGFIDIQVNVTTANHSNQYD